MGAILQKSAVYDYCKRWTRATHATILTVRSPGTGTIPGYLEDDMKIWKPTSVWSTLTNLTHLRLDCIHDDWSRSNIALLLPTPLFFEASNLTHLTLCAIDWDDVSAWASFWGSVPASLRELYFVDFDFDVGLYKLLRADLLGGMDLKSLSKVVWIVEDAQTAFRDWKAFELDFLEDSTKNGPEDHRITMALQDAEEASFAGHRYPPRSFVSILSTALFWIGSSMTNGETCSASCVKFGGYCAPKASAAVVGIASSTRTGIGGSAVS